mmetsp:Transcript_117737/g.375311  ORF Transcript_117737/g.375311 Transcript_117737/m.375311 type:complete len:229 (-) Transcript_117737:187-873(-)|eukprot:CAMPEP_0203860862 /NCGR_PEP_ID=MMETSP0359-20131031/12680_1 /ASSEMBLY_ACC=CAM_ASM_000338 /TAXON_ID=268821 /ORGANISM="Scrippsiella Hangoei, Strain SHTV-5" /LENGTH=228 /DNA_ID=CAMNT_0050778013 /DNA_START=100 /DNA_END=786 /DNA_ORIENTATION=-
MRSLHVPAGAGSPQLRRQTATSASSACSTPQPKGAVTAAAAGPRTPQRAALELPIEHRRSPFSARTPNSVEGRLHLGGAAAATAEAGPPSSERRPLAPVNSVAFSLRGTGSDAWAAQHSVSPAPLMRNLTNLLENAQLHQLLGAPSPVRSGTRVTRRLASFKVHEPGVGDDSAKEGSSRGFLDASPMSVASSSEPQTLMPSLGSPGPLGSPLGSNEVASIIVGGMGRL